MSVAKQLRKVFPVKTYINTYNIYVAGTKKIQSNYQFKLSSEINEKRRSTYILYIDIVMLKSTVIVIVIVIIYD